MNVEKACNLLPTRDIVLIGDFNVDLTLHRNPMHCQIYGLKQLITNPTRATCESSTLIDHIYTSMPDKHTKSGVVKWTISDHFLIFTVIGQGKIPKQTK